MEATYLPTPSRCLDAIAGTDERRSNIQTVAQQLRLARLEIGAILEGLESFDLSPESLERLRDAVDSVADDATRLELDRSAINGR